MLFNNLKYFQISLQVKIATKLFASKSNRNKLKSQRGKILLIYELCRDVEKNYNESNTYFKI